MDSIAIRRHMFTYMCYQALTEARAAAEISKNPQEVKCHSKPHFFVVANERGRHPPSWQLLRHGMTSSS